MIFCCRSNMTLLILPSPIILNTPRSSRHRPSSLLFMSIHQVRLPSIAILPSMPRNASSIRLSFLWISIKKWPYFSLWSARFSSRSSSVFATYLILVLAHSTMWCSAMVQWAITIRSYKLCIMVFWWVKYTAKCKLIVIDVDTFLTLQSKSVIFFIVCILMMWRSIWKIGLP